MRRMPYHVEIRRGRRHARLFNLGEAELQQTVIRPWQLGVTLTLADQRWERRECRLRILEGPALEGVDLAHGQGWHNAERSAREVTEPLLEGGLASRVAVLAYADTHADAAQALLERLGLHAVGWAPVRRRIVAWLAQPETLPDLGVAAVLVLLDAAVPRWWAFDAGLAIGALGPRAVPAQLGGSAPPSALEGLAILALDPQAPDSVAALVERLRYAGCAVAL
jgi:hypothetical protein